MHIRIIGVLAASAAVMASGANAEQGFLQIKGQKTGEIKGDAMQKGHEGWNTVQSLEYGLSVPGDAASGMATGRRTHQPISFTLKWSKATPLLLGAASSNEILSEVHFQRWTPSINSATGIGTETDTDHIDLTNARITSLKIVDLKDDDGKLDAVVIVNMTYQKLTITHPDGGISAEDSWGQ